ncbi:MAG: VOC family protein [Acidimicrobiia bacterium]
MPKRDEAPIGAPCWIDLFTSGTDGARTFYGELFGWTSESAGPEYGGYITFSMDGIPVAGCMANDGEPGAPEVWSVYLATDDAEAAVQRAVAAGGQVVMPATQLMELGSMAVLSDVGGASIGAWQPGLHKGFGILDEPGSAAWFELHTRDYDASVRFYREAFKWDTHAASDADDFRYTTLGEGDAMLAGIMDASAFLPEGVPAQWSIYFGVDDVDVTLEQVVDLGGSVVRAAEDTPYGHLAEAADPTGARFKLRG